MKSGLIKLVIAVLLGIIVAIILFAVFHPLGTCDLCGGSRYHAPCLVNRSTGEVVELTVYDPHPKSGGEIAETQQTGTFRFIQGAGALGVRDTSAHTCTVQLSEEGGRMTAHFCGECRELLSKPADSAFVLLDLYDLDAIQAYSVVDGADYAIRDYDVSVRYDADAECLVVAVTGKLLT